MPPASDSSRAHRGVLEPLRRLGESLESAWARHDFDEEVFSRLAGEHLEAVGLPEALEVEAIVDWVFGDAHAFRQPVDNHFGEPPVTLFEGNRFSIEALFWFSGTTAIHEHAFSGAFAVLAGSSVHSRWRFHPERRVNSRMLTGRLERDSSEILMPGAVRPIEAGSQLIHQLFHLEAPSVTVVARTDADRGKLPQYRYLPPGLALDPDTEDPLAARRSMLVEAMLRGDLGGLDRNVRQWIDEGGLESLYPLFSLLHRRRARGLAAFRDLARQRHGEVIDRICAACAWERRTRTILRLRRRTDHPDARFLLAALMLMPDRGSLFELLELRYPGRDPVAVVEAALDILAAADALPFQLDAANRLIFRALLEGRDEEGVLSLFEAAFEADSVRSGRRELLEHAADLAASELFRPLFSESPLRPDAL